MRSRCALIALAVAIVVCGALCLGRCAAPQAKVGEQFLFVPSVHWSSGPGRITNDESQPYIDASTGRPVPWESIVLRVLTLKSISSRPFGKPLLTFSLEGYRHRVVAKCDGNVPPRAFRIIDNASSRALRLRYQGRIVRAYGSVYTWGETRDPARAYNLRTGLRPMRVHRVCRVAGGLHVPAQCDPTYARAYAENPLIVVLEPGGPVTLSGGNDTGLDTGHGTEGGLPVDVNKDCVRLWNVVCGEWDMKGSYSLTDPVKKHSQWPRRFWEGIAQGGALAGMSREMVLWAMGWPLDQYKTYEEASKSDTWVFHDGSPWDYTVYFKNGTVAEVNSGPNMP